MPPFSRGKAKGVSFPPSSKLPISLASKSLRFVPEKQKPKANKFSGSAGIPSFRSLHVSKSPHPSSKSKGSAAARGPHGPSSSLSSIAVPAHVLAEHDKPLPAPSEWYFDPKQLTPLHWRTPYSPTCGLMNPGTNICFMNATLQALAAAPSFGEDLRLSLHSRSCQHRCDNSFCALCLLELQIQHLASGKGGPPRENRIYMNVKRLIWRQYRIGRQEDAHEFLRFLMEALARGCLPPHSLAGTSSSFHQLPLASAIDDVSWMTTYVCQQFGGWYKSTIQCHDCGYRSNKYDPFMDVPMEIAGVTSLEKAFARFVKPEELEESNRYMCPVCNQKRDALKTLVIYTPPRLLTVPLKRFGFTPGFCASKNCRALSFPLKLDLSSFVHHHGTAWRCCQYQLWAVVCHLGHSLRAGHYVTYAKAPNDLWYKYDDERVTPVGLKTVLGQKEEAYILFYSRIKEPPLCDAADSPFSVCSSSTTSTAASETDLLDGRGLGGHPQQPRANTSNDASAGQSTTTGASKVPTKTKAVKASSDEKGRRETPAKKKQSVGSARSGKRASPVRRPRVAGRREGERRKRGVGFMSRRLKRLGLLRLQRKKRERRKEMQESKVAKGDKQGKRTALNVEERLSSTSYTSQFGSTAVKRWESSNPAVRWDEPSADFVAAQKKLQPPPKERSELDLEYDKGRLKKLKSKDKQERKHNAFHSFVRNQS